VKALFDFRSEPGRGGWPLRLAAAVVMAGCSALHLAVAARSAHAPALHLLALVGMALICVPCATHALLAPERRTWIQAGWVSAGMLSAHPLLGLHQGEHAGHTGSSMPVAVTVGMVVGPALGLCLASVGALAGSWGDHARGV
jgi:hypothetical protein